jgi:hypothetical protein
MKLYLNIILIAFFSIPCWATRTETQTVEEDGTVKTVITDEWTEERHVRGRGRGQGDTIVVMTSDNDNEEHQTSEGTSDGQQSCNNITSRTVPLKRLFNGVDSYTYSIDQQDETTLTKAGYKLEETMGRVVAQQSDFPDCHDLVPITRVTLPIPSGGFNIMMLNAPSAFYIRIGGWPEAGGMGYAVMEKGKCGATIPVRQLRSSKSFLQITDADGESDAYKSLGYAIIPNIALDFYVWDEKADFCPQPRPIEKKTALLTRLFNTILSDFEYVTNPKVKEILTKPTGGYRFDGNLGRVVIKPSDLPECKDLVPIIKMFHSSSTNHVLLVDQAIADSWVKEGWTNAGVIGYGVLEKGKCDATAEVRYWSVQQANVNWLLHYQTAVLSQYEILKNLYGCNDGGTKNFYIWEP